MPLLVLLFIVLPLAELYVIIEIGGAIGILPTLALLVVDSIVGAALARSQGRAAWERFNRALAEGRVPAREVFDGAMIIVGGTLLLTPGFITDVFGLLLLLPPTRAVVQRLLARGVAGRARFAWRVSPLGGRAEGAGRRPDPWREPRAPSYDYEGSAREVGEGELEAPPAQPTEERPPGG